MKKNLSSYTYLLICITFLLGSATIRSQEQYIGNQGEIIGTPDSRVVISIIETEEHVKLEVATIGEILADGLCFTMVYQPESLVLTDSTFLYDIPLGSPEEYGSPVISKTPEFINLLPAFGTQVISHRLITGGDASGMKCLNTYTSVTIMDITAVLSSERGQMIPLYTIYFRKTIPGSPLSISDIGFYSNDRIPRIFSSWIYRGVSVTFGKASVSESFYQNSDLFAYRSPSLIKMSGINSTTPNSANLNGYFMRGNFSPTNSIIVSGANSSSNYGRLNYDQINMYGFIYSDAEAEIVINDRLNKMHIDNIEYDFPTIEELNSGLFMRGGKLFNTKIFNNNSQEQLVEFNMQITGLESETDYYVWPFIRYKFETSDNYFTIGEKSEFKTGQQNRQKSFGNLISDENVINIFPNPATDHINIIGNLAGHLTICDLLGKKIYEKNISQGEKVDIRNLSSGTYVVKLENRAGDVFFKNLIVK